MLSFVLTFIKGDVSTQPLVLQTTPSSILFLTSLKYPKYLTLKFLIVGVSPIGFDVITEKPCSLDCLHINPWMQTLDSGRPFVLECLIQKWVIPSLQLLGSLGAVNTQLQAHLSIQAATPVIYSNFTTDMLLISYNNPIRVFYLLPILWLLTDKVLLQETN